jgi:hypothetical protein
MKLLRTDLDHALDEIAAIRGQIARGVEFRGYGPATVAATGVLAFVAAGAQSALLADPAAHVPTYLALWIGTAGICAALIGVEMVLRSRREHLGLAEEMVRGAIEQLVPATVAGALLTLVLAASAPESIGLLPGLWQIVFSLGVFASAPFLPRATQFVAGWYLATGLFAIAFARGDALLSPWAMAVPFGLGQLAGAAILWSSLREDGDGRP